MFCPLTWFVLISTLLTLLIYSTRRETDEMSPRPAAVRVHALIQTHPRARTGPHERRRLHTLLFYFGCVDTRGGLVPKHGARGGGTFRVSGQSAPRARRTFFRVTHTRDSIDARAGGACVLNINPQTTAALTWGYYWMKRAKNSRSLEVQTFYDWKCGCYARGGV